MKILMLTPYVTIDGNSKFERNKTGFGYMVMDIAKAVGKLEDVEVLATDTRGEAFETADVKFLKRSLPSYILNLFSCLPLNRLIQLRKQYPMSKRSFVRVAYYWLMTGYLCKLIKKNKYDIVHIHGCGFSTELWMQVCNSIKQKYVVTLHGLNSFSDTIHLEQGAKQYERGFLKSVVDGMHTITVISTGMKKKIEKMSGIIECKQICVVCNSFSFNEIQKNNHKVREKYGIPPNGKVVLSVGNIANNKNQIQLVRSFSHLSEDMQRNTYVLFCGKPDPKCGVELEIAKQKLYSHFLICGVIDKKDLSAFYRESDCVVLLSIAEGFGLSLIEGMHFGKPCMSFTDVDAFMDIYNPDAMIGVGSHSDEAVAEGLELLLTKNWDKNRIVECSRKFDSITMAKNYIKVYKGILAKDNQ